MSGISIYNMEEHGLDDSCVNFIGRKLHIKPIYGWGWSGNPEEPLPPEEFDICLTRLWNDEKGRRGGIGVVKEPNHPCNEWNVVFSTRHVGLFNFTDRLGDYNIFIFDGEVVEKNGWPLPSPDCKSYAGFCQIGQ